MRQHLLVTCAKVASRLHRYLILDFIILIHHPHMLLLGSSSVRSLLLLSPAIYYLVAQFDTRGGTSLYWVAILVVRWCIFCDRRDSS
jgi:hypothetical protein